MTSSRVITSGECYNGDLKIYCEELRNKGVSFNVESWEFLPGISICYVTALDGVSIELIQAYESQLNNFNTKIDWFREQCLKFQRKGATGEVAEIYQDIRETTNVPFPQAIWRNLATKGGALQWVWYSLKPMYQSGAVAHYASELRSSLDVPSISTIPESEFNILGISELFGRARDIKSRKRKKVHMIKWLKC